jgi:branched-chain amino acid aminotransferase
VNNSEQYQALLNHSTVYINGEYCPSQTAKISVFDRGFLYGDSIYEVSYSENGVLLFYHEHLKRLHNSAKLLEMPIFLSDATITNQVVDTLKHSGLKDAYLRIILTRGESIISLDPHTSFRNNLVTIAKPKTVYPQEFYDNGVYLHLSDVLRNDPRSVDPNAKSGNYLNNVLAMNDAKKQGADDAIMVNRAGHVTEGTTFNIWKVKNQTLCTPPVESGLLAGITRKKIIEICELKNIPFQIANFSPEELLQADEVFITSSTRKIIPVRKINQTVFPQPWKQTRNLMEEFKTYLSQHQDRIPYL